MAVRPQVVKSFAEGNTGRMYVLTFSAAKYAYMLMLALVLPVCFEIKFILSIWLGENTPADTYIFVILILLTYLMETYHSASLMSYHAIGKIKLGNIVGGTLMIIALPLSYVALKMGAPPYTVFIVIFFINFTQMFWGWMIVHKYVKFSYRHLFKVVYVPTILVTLISIIVPGLIVFYMESGWGRFLMLCATTEIVLLLTVFYVGLTREDRTKCIEIINRRILKK